MAMTMMASQPLPLPAAAVVVVVVSSLRRQFMQWAKPITVKS